MYSHQRPILPACSQLKHKCCLSGWSGISFHCLSHCLHGTRRQRLEVIHKLYTPSQPRNRLDHLPLSIFLWMKEEWFDLKVIKKGGGGRKWRDMVLKWEQRSFCCDIYLDSLVRVAKTFLWVFTESTGRRCSLVCYVILVSFCCESLHGKLFQHKWKENTTLSFWKY